MFLSAPDSLPALQEALAAHYSQLKGHPFEPTQQRNATVATSGIINTSDDHIVNGWHVYPHPPVAGLQWSL